MMKRELLSLCAVASFGLVLGCPFTPHPEAVLEGTWTVTPADPGDFDGFTYEARFDANGNLVELTGASPDGGSANLAIDDATTDVNGDAVTVTIPRLTGASVFEGTLNAAQDTIVGSITQEIDLGDLDIILPSGELTLERVAS